MCRLGCLLNRSLQLWRKNVNITEEDLSHLALSTCGWIIWVFPYFHPKSCRTLIILRSRNRIVHRFAAAYIVVYIKNDDWFVSKGRKKEPPLTWNIYNLSSHRIRRRDSIYRRASTRYKLSISTSKLSAMRYDYFSVWSSIEMCSPTT